MRSNARAVLIGVAASLMGLNAQAALIPIAGGLGVYDDVNNVTWAADGNLFATQAASYSGGASAYVAAVIAASGGVIQDTPNRNVPSGIYTLSALDFVTEGSSTGALRWWAAKAWVNYLNATNYAGSSLWALPTTVNADTSYGFPNGGVGNPSQSSSQMAQLFYGGLGQVPGSSITSTQNSSYELFTNLQPALYWSGTDTFAGSRFAWNFTAGNGDQSSYFKTSSRYALAVSPGNISAVPEPSVAWLLGTGLLGVVGLRRRRPTAVGLQSRA